MAILRVDRQNRKGVDTNPGRASRYHRPMMEPTSGVADGWRLAFDVGPVRERPTGVGVYAASLARALAEAMPDGLVLLGRRAEIDGHMEFDVGTRVPTIPFRGRNYHEWLQRRANSDARRAGADLVHYTNAGAPIAAGSLPYVLTVHDMSLLRMPRSHPVLRLATLPVSLAAIARARAIVVPSESSRRELRRLGVSPRRLTVIPHAPSATLSRNVEASGIVAELGLADRGYVLSIGTLEPRKNHVRLVSAFEKIAAGHPRLRLVIVGGTGWHSAPILRRIDASLVRERIVLAGYLRGPDLAALIRRSAAVAYVSLYEGYGLPIIEAMAVGAAVVTSRVSAMPEAAGGAGVLVDPRDVEDIARGISTAIRGHDGLVAAGRARSAGRTWVDVANETIGVYRWALGRE
jgi:glycosyltransferase involved in cell wall biosynthesis